MTLKEFFKCPEDTKKAKACKTIYQFKKLVNGFEISYNGVQELKEVYDLVKHAKKELLDDDLSAVAGSRYQNKPYFD